MFFKARNATNGIELWKSDGTEAGTVQVKDIRAGGLSSTPFDLTNVSGTLYFNAYEGPATARELWKSDGTELGTMLIKDINSGSGSSTPEEFNAFTGDVFFRADDGFNGYELWKSDGTELGTVMVKDINTGAFVSGLDSFSPAGFTDFNGTLFFVANDGASGWELWKSDGTEAGSTVLFKDINRGPGDGMAPFNREA